MLDSYQIHGLQIPWVVFTFLILSFERKAFHFDEVQCIYFFLCVFGAVGVVCEKLLPDPRS